MLNRTYMKKSEKSNNKQNKRLFVILILQMLAITSVWGDFLNLYESYIITRDVTIKSNLFCIISIVLPIILLIILTLWIISLFIQNKNMKKVKKHCKNTLR